MPQESSLNNYSEEDIRTAMEIAEEKITKWKRNPEEHKRYSVKYKFKNFDEEVASVTYSSVFALNLKGLGLKTVPENLRTIRGLELLDLEGNNIQELPSWIGELSSLECINLIGNELRELPPEIGSLNKLHYLFLQNNCLQSLPETMHALCTPHQNRPSLRYLGLDMNSDLGLPDSIILRPPEEIIRYYFESRDEKGQPLLVPFQSE